MADGSSFLGICSSLFREEGYPTIYDGLRNQIWLDVTVFRLCFLFTILVVSFLCILPGFRGIKVGSLKKIQIVVEIFSYRDSMCLFDGCFVS